MVLFGTVTLHRSLLESRVCFVIDCVVSVTDGVNLHNQEAAQTFPRNSYLISHSLRGHLMTFLQRLNLNAESLPHMY